jgi:hypothetical protein
MTDRPEYTIIDRTGVLWRSEGARGLSKGIAILDAVDAGNEKGYRNELGMSWDGGSRARAGDPPQPMGPPRSIRLKNGTHG